uniref:Uncharacterized protein n=1 Tax=Acanthochromis polyacanthus TaxID=80966 RepID=A0A3Q1FCJ0_9TELE
LFVNTKISAPTISAWTKNMGQYKSMERIIIILKDTLEVFMDIWKPFDDFIRSKDTKELQKEEHPKNDTQSPK